MSLFRQEDLAQLVSVSIPVEDLEKSAIFYEKVLGVKLAYSLTESRESFHAVISAGVQLLVDKIQPKQKKSVMLHFAVGNLEKFKKTVVGSGGKIVADKIHMPISDKVFKLLADEHRGLRSTNNLGTMSIIMDPEGNQFVAMQLEDWAQYLFTNGNISIVESESHKAGIKIGDKFRKLLNHS